MKHQWISILLGISMVFTMVIPGFVVQASEQGALYEVTAGVTEPPADVTEPPAEPIITPTIQPTPTPTVLCGTMPPAVQPTSTPTISCDTMPPTIQPTISCDTMPPTEPPVGEGTSLGRKVLLENTTWTLEQSPYTMYGEIQIPKGITLTIEPGVVVNGNGNGIRVCGSIKGIGTEEKNIALNNVSVCNYGNTTANPALIQIEYAKINGGTLYTQSMGEGHSYGSLILKNSYLTGIEEPIYFNRPQADCQIEKNIFVGTQFSCLTGNGKHITIQNNVFYNYQYAAVESKATGEASELVVKYNSFLNTDRTALRLNGDTAKMTATENYFNTVDPAVVGRMVYDKADDARCDNYITYEPYLQTAHEDTPIPPVQVTPAPVVPTPEPQRSQLGGVIHENCFLTKEQSPYYLAQDVHVAPGVTLEIEPGVEIYATEQGDSILSYGTLRAAGTGEEMVLFDQIDIQSRGKTPESPAVMELDHVKLEDSRVESRGSGYLVLTNSYLRSDGRDLVSLSYPTLDCRIEKNIIENASISSLLQDGVTALIQNNTFYNYEDYAVKNVACYGEAQFIVRYNSFLTTNKTALALEGDDAAMAATENYFNTVEKQTVEAMIYDRNDDLACEGFIAYEPFLEAPHPDTPVVEVVAVPGNPPIEYAENELGGILLEDRVLTRENSPYIMVERVQVGEEATLTIEPGVVICGEGNSLQLFGKLEANGTEEENIVFNDTSIECWGKEGEIFSTVQLSFAEINGGSLIPPTGYHGALQLTDSYVHDLDGEVYLWYPTADCNIERNILDGVSISVGIKEGIIVLVRNNVFYKYKDFAVESWNQTSDSQLLVQYNSFLEAGETTLMYAPGYNGAGMVATDNYFNTTAYSMVLRMIYDQNKNLSCSGRIPYKPYLIDHHEDTPYDETKMTKIQGDSVIDWQTQYHFILTSDNIEADNVQWSVDNDEIASIDEDGILSPKKQGAVTVTAEAYGRVKQRTIMIWSRCPSMYFENITYDSGTGKVTGTCHNILQQDLMVCLVAAAYDAKGQVTGVWLEPKTTLYAGRERTFESSALNVPSEGTVKVFALSTIDGMIPLAVNAQLQVSGA